MFEKTRMLRTHADIGFVMLVLDSQGREQGRVRVLALTFCIEFLRLCECRNLKLSRLFLRGLTLTLMKTKVMSTSKSIKSVRDLDIKMLCGIPTTPALESSLRSTNLKSRVRFMNEDES